MNLESAPEHPTSSAFMLMNSSALNASSFRDPLLTDNFSLETNEEESVEELSTVQLLIQHLRNELGSPELLSYPTDFMEELFELITTQRQLIGQHPTEHLQQLMAMELERIQYYIKCFLLARLSKVIFLEYKRRDKDSQIERFHRHILQTPSVMSRLSQAEVRYIQRYNKLVEKHYVETSLQPLDQSLHSLNDTAVEPRLQDPVVVHVTRNIGEIMLENGLTLALEKGDIYITQYRFIQSHLLEGQIELI